MKIFKKWWFWVIVVLLVIGALNGEKNAGKEEAAVTRTAMTEAAQETPAPTATPKPTPKPTDTPEPTPTPYRVWGFFPDKEVYVSNSGKVHLDSDCSGMKSYTTMTIEEAYNAGYERCERCW